ncbi:MAG TPA: SDR family NAD(P)-dependent oxidoreductase [Mobilitalea sp.]|nr:SDR family NAD(P)-dependent oxidoreductase [Mobilitalea sp.]
MNRIVLITGASRGLGLCLTKRYLIEGATVLAGVRDLTASFINELKTEYPDALIPVLLEVADTESVNQAAELVKGYTDHIDIVVNNAAICGKKRFLALDRKEKEERVNEEAIGDSEAC